MAYLALRGRRQRDVLVLLALIFAAASLFCQSAEIDYNRYYRFPLSIGAEYQSLSPFPAYGSLYNIFDLSFNLRYPLPTVPALQPVLKLGLMRFDSQDPAEPAKWDHSHWYGAIGTVYSHRFARAFEVGAEATIGFSEALFPDLLPEEGTVSSLNLLLELGARIALNPSYSFNLDVHPGIRYQRSLNPLKEMKGTIPDMYSCDGADISPELNWTGVPEGTQSLALIMDDPDAPAGTWVHWVIYNIPADATGLEENLPKTMELANGAVQGLNDFMAIGYGGPCPPSGQSHRYFFTLYAIDTEFELEAVLNKAMLLATIEGHVLAEAQIMGNFQS